MSDTPARNAATVARARAALDRIERLAAETGRSIELRETEAGGVVVGVEGWLVARERKRKQPCIRPHRRR